MKNYKKKGEYLLVEDLFPEELRKHLPVNAFLLREALSRDLSFDARRYVKSNYHRTDKYIAGYFYKNISSII